MTAVVVIHEVLDAGFEFVIPDPLPAGPTQAQLVDPDFAASKGFGIIYEFRTWIEDIDPVAAQFDPNQAYLTTLSGAEIQRFYQVLEGEEPEPGQLPDDAGCRGRAAEVAYADWDRFFDALPTFTALGEERDSHPDWLAARAEWKDCMVAAGYDYSEPEAIRSDVQRRMNDAVASVYPDGRVPLVNVGSDWTLDPVVEPLIVDLERFEIDAAVANIECAEPLADRFGAVEREVQQAFVDRNQATIDELLAER